MYSYSVRICLPYFNRQQASQQARFNIMRSRTIMVCRKATEASGTASALRMFEHTDVMWPSAIHLGLHNVCILWWCEMFTFIKWNIPTWMESVRSSIIVLSQGFGGLRGNRRCFADPRLQSGKTVRHRWLALPYASSKVPVSFTVYETPSTIWNGLCNMLMPRFGIHYVQRVFNPSIHHVLVEVVFGGVFLEDSNYSKLSAWSRSIESDIGLSNSLSVTGKDPRAVQPFSFNFNSSMDQGKIFPFQMLVGLPRSVLHSIRISDFNVTPSIPIEIYSCLLW